MARVLVIDDDVGSAELLRVVLDDAGFDVTVARTEPEIPRGAFDVVVTDLLTVTVYSRDEARDWILRLADRFPRVPVVVVTAHPEARNDHEALGVTSVIVKPFDVEVIPRAVRAAITS